MADGRRRQIAPVRKLIAAVLGTFATFVILFGAGMTSWTIVALGVALLVLSIGLVVVTSVRTGARAWVAGIGHVHSVSEPPASSTFGRCELQIVIDAPGLPPRSVKVRDSRVPVAKWPDPGATLPIMVAIDDQRHVRILWDEVLTHAESAAAAADLSSGYDLYGSSDDDVLIEGDAPPWAHRGPDDDFRTPTGGEPVTADLTEELGNLSNLGDEPMVMRQTPGGTIVLEGSLVEPPITAPLPRRAKTSPGHEETSIIDQAQATITTEPDSDDAQESLADLIAAQPSAQVGGSGTIHGVGITLLVTDLDRSVTFYRDMLGFFEIDGGEGNAVLASGATRIVLRAIPDVAPINRRLVHLNLEVDDVQAVYEELRSKDIRFTYAPRAVNRGEKLELWAAAFRDPDGHGIALTQWRSRSST